MIIFLSYFCPGSINFYVLICHSAICHYTAPYSHHEARLLKHLPFKESSGSLILTMTGSAGNIMYMFCPKF